MKQNFLKNVSRFLFRWTRSTRWLNAGRNRRELMLLFTGAMVLLVSGCPVTPIEVDVVPGFVDDGTIGVDSELFQEDEGDSSIVYFETNDPEYWTERGYTLWALRDETERTFSSVDVTLTKISGEASAGYGIVVNQRDDDEYGTVLLVVMINVQGEYIVGEVIENEFTALVPWTVSEALDAGYNQTNRIAVSYDEVNESYTLTIDGEVETTFEDAEAPFHREGYGGYVTVISHLDTFPDTPVKTQFYANE